ncbi:NAD(P)H-binding protein [Pedococcus sp. NPDC057267]|uniref:NAD(P)H-binding protein n=1 Tax=Pedococcus sp. NPDC057267 TaxID=3346077 RepID=UPI003634ED69
MRVTVMGAGGYIGSRLVPVLLADGHEVTATFTDPARARRFPWAGAVRVAGLDVADRAAARDAAAGADALVYLVHGLAGPDFTTADREGAYNAAHAAVRARVGRIVYLGGLVPDVPEGTCHRTCARGSRSSRSSATAGCRRGHCAPRWSSGPGRRRSRSCAS